MPGDDHVLGVSGSLQILGNAGLLGSGDEVIQEHAHPPARPWAECTQRVDQMICTIQWLHHNALDAQVITPDALDERRIVNALYPDAARTSYSCRGIRHGDGPRRR